MSDDISRWATEEGRRLSELEENEKIKSELHTLIDAQDDCGLRKLLAKGVAIDNEAMSLGIKTGNLELVAMLLKAGGKTSEMPKEYYMQRLVEGSLVCPSDMLLEALALYDNEKHWDYLLLYGGHVVTDDKYNYGNIIARKGDSREDVIRRVFFLVEALR